MTLILFSSGDSNKGKIARYKDCSEPDCLIQHLKKAIDLVTLQLFDVQNKVKN